MSKPHSWEVEEVDGGPVGFADVWHCAECGACGGHVDRSGDYPAHVFLAGPALPLSASDCDQATTRELRISFVMPGHPVSWQRTRVNSNGSFFTPTAMRRHKKSLAQTADATLHVWQLSELEMWPRDGEYALSCRFYMPSYHAVDVDNMLKAVADALEGLLYENDRQISQTSGLRVYGDPNPRTEVTVTYLGGKPVKSKAPSKRKARVAT